MTDNAESDPIAYWLTAETDVVHTDGCRYRHGSLNWPQWPGRRPRACSACLPDGLPKWEHDAVYFGVGRLVSRPGTPSAEGGEGVG